MQNMVLKKLIKKLVDITVRVFVKIFTQIKIGRYFLYKLNEHLAYQTQLNISPDGCEFSAA